MTQAAWAEGQSIFGERRSISDARLGPQPARAGEGEFCAAQPSSAAARMVRQHTSLSRLICKNAMPGVALGYRTAQNTFIHKSVGLDQPQDMCPTKPARHWRACCTPVLAALNILLHSSYKVEWSYQRLALSIGPMGPALLVSWMRAGVACLAHSVDEVLQHQT